MDGLDRWVESSRGWALENKMEGRWVDGWGAQSVDGWMDVGRKRGQAIKLIARKMGNNSWMNEMGVFVQLYITHWSGNKHRLVDSRNRCPQIYSRKRFLPSTKRVDPATCCVSHSNQPFPLGACMWGCTVMFVHACLCRHEPLVSVYWDCACDTRTKARAIEVLSTHAAIFVKIIS